jgi:Ser-tRNA(Ala) deacylase AlaX
MADADGLRWGALVVVDRVIHGHSNVVTHIWLLSRVPPLTPRPLAGISGNISVGDSVTVKVDYGRRGQIVPNHTFTHVLNFALREILGDHVDQKGSIVLPDK